jgi:hypothetical protein
MITTSRTYCFLFAILKSSVNMLIHRSSYRDILVGQHPTLRQSYRNALIGQQRTPTVVISMIED